SPAPKRMSSFSTTGSSSSACWQVARTCSAELFRAAEADAVLDEAVLERVPRGFRAVCDAKLPVDVRQVELHGLLGDPELFRDRLVRQTAGNGAKDDELAFRETRFLGSSLAGVPGHPDRGEDRPFDRLTKCSRKVDGIHALDDVGVGATFEHRRDHIRIL